MKAIRVPRHGGPEVLEIADLPTRGRAQAVLVDDPRRGRQSPRHLGAARHAGMAAAADDPGLRRRGRDRRDRSRRH
jgi:hypothetical protein